MAAEFELKGPCAKKSKADLFDLSLCIFCNEPFSDSSPASTPIESKLKTLFEACRLRNDNIAQKLLPQENAIVMGHVSFRYHRNCRSTYTSKHHIKRIHTKNVSSASYNDGGGLVDSTASSSCFSRTRSQSPFQEFNWKTKCFICGGSCFQAKRISWCMVETAVDSDPDSPNLYTKVLKAADKRDDQALLTRLQGVVNGDLVAVEARYHKKCSTYYNPRNITASAKVTSRETLFNKCIQLLIDEFKQSIEAKQVFLLTTITNRFKELLSENGHGGSEKYTTQKLKHQLMREWPGVSFIPQPGASDLVCSSEITVGEAICQAHDIMKVLKESEPPDKFPENVSSASEETIIHEAMGILQERIMATEKLDEYYYSADEMTAKDQKTFLDPLLLKALGWLTSPKLHTNADEFSRCGQSHSKRCLNIACDIVTLATSITSPKHLGLAVYLHHEYGSRKLIELMHDMGYTISYTELRRFLTSAALHVSSLQDSTDLGCYVPPELAAKDNGGHFIVGAADNWDHNERTVDGKRTTHAMTSILVQAKAEITADPPRLKKSTSRTLDVENLPGEFIMKWCIYL